MSSSSSSSFSIVCTELSFSWPDGTPVFDGLDVAFGARPHRPDRANGSGKSTLLRLIAGELAPADGHRPRRGRGRLSAADRRRSTPACGSTSCSASPRRAPRCTPSRRATSTEEHFDAVGDDWDVEERARADARPARPRPHRARPHRRRALRRRGRPAAPGRAVAAPARRAAARRAHQQPRPRRPAPALRRGRGLAGRAWSWSATTGSCSTWSTRSPTCATAESAATAATCSAYEEALAAEQEAAERELRSPRPTCSGSSASSSRPAPSSPGAAVRQEDVRQQARAEDLMNARKREAQVSAGKHRIMHTTSSTEAQRAARRGRGGRRATMRRSASSCRAPRSPPAAPVSRCPDRGATPARQARRCGSIVRGPERIALLGPTARGRPPCCARSPASSPGGRDGAAHVPLRYLPQRLDVLDESSACWRTCAPPRPAPR